MSDKTLTIGVKSDVAGAKPMLDMLKQFAATGSQAAKVLQSMRGEGSKAVAGGGMAKSILGQISSMDKLGASGKKLSDIFSKDLAKAEEVLGQRIEGNTKRISKALEVYEKWNKLAQSARLSGAGADALQAEAMAERAKMGMAASLGNRVSDQGKLAALGGGGIKSQVMEAMGSIPGLSGIMGIAGPVGALMAAGKLAQMAYHGYREELVGREERAWRPMELEAKRGQGMAPYETAILSGSAISKSYLDQAKREQGGAISTAVGAQREGLNADLIVAQAKIALSKIFPDFVFGGMRQRAEAQMENAGTEYLMAGQMAPAQAAGQLAAADQVGAMRKSMAEQSAVKWRMWNRMLGKNATGNALGVAQHGQVSEDEFINMQMGLRASGGYGALKYSGSVLGAHLRGWDAGEAASIAGQGSVSGNILNALQNTGLSDPTVQAAIGRNIASQLNNPSDQMVSMSSLVNMAASGVGVADGNSAMQRRMVSQNLLGMQKMREDSGGRTPWDQSYNLISAIETSPNASIYQQQRLSKLPMDQMIAISQEALRNGGKANIPLAWGDITINDINNTIGSRMSGSVRKWRDQGRTDTQSNLMRDLQKNYSGDVTKFSQSEGWALMDAKTKEDYIQRASGAIAAANGEYGQEGAVAGELRVAMGLAEHGTRKGKGKGGVEEQSLVDKMAETQTMAGANAVKEFATVTDKATKTVQDYATTLERLHFQEKIKAGWVPTLTATGKNPGRQAGGAP